MKRRPPAVTPAADRVAVVCRTPGVQSVGPYAAGVVHTVSSAEAQRLIAHKGFCLASQTTTATPTPPQGGES